MAFEQEFGRGRELPPITVDTEHGNVLIEGKIDRVDMLPDDRVKIIDYKTGNEIFNTVEARKGYRLQLMLYLKAAMGAAGAGGAAPDTGADAPASADQAVISGADGGLKPAGVFYFLINEPFVKIEGAGNASEEELEAKVAEAITKEYKMNGVIVNDPEVIRSIAGEFNGYSQIVQLRNSKSGGISGTGKDSLMNEADFDAFQSEVDAKIREICSDLASGKQQAHPMKTKSTSACAYCNFRGICRFDVKFEDCNYEFI
jgi:ATP-dependent helicase/nuclease subunit B